MLRLLFYFTVQPQLIRERIQQQRSDRVEKEQGKNWPPDYANPDDWAAHPWENVLLQVKAFLHKK